MGAPRRRLFDQLKQGLEEGIAHARGELPLRTSAAAVPAPPRAYTADDVRRIRARLNMSQPGFANLLQVSSKTVQSWEQGLRRPRKSSARLLQFIEDPQLLTSLQQAP